MAAAELSDEEASARQRGALLAALALIIVWGVNFSVQKVVFEAVTPGGFLFVRYLMMPLAAVLLLWWRHALRWPRVPREDLVALLKLGLAGHVLHISLATFGIHWSTAFSSSVILASGPVFTLLILRWSGHERLAGVALAGVALALAGVLVFLSDKLFGGNWRASGGDAVLLASAAFFSYYTVAAKPLIERHGGVVVMTYATLLGSAPVLLLALPAGLQVDWTALPAAIWAGVLWAVLVSAFLGWIVWGWVNAVLGVARTAPLIYLMPPVAGVVAWLLGGEQFTAIKLAGAGLALAGVALAQFGGGKVPDPVLDAAPPVD